MLFWWFGLKLYFGDKRIPDELHMEHETKEKPAMSPRVKSSKSFFCLLFFLCAIFLIYLKLPLGVKRKECLERREDYGVKRDNGGRNRERYPSGGGQAGSPSERASWGTFPTGNRRRWVLRKPSSVGRLPQHEAGSRSFPGLVWMSIHIKPGEEKVRAYENE